MLMAVNLEFGILSVHGGDLYTCGRTAYSATLRGSSKTLTVFF